VRALCQFSLFVSQQNHSDLSHRALGDVMKRFFKNMVACGDQKMSKSVKTTVNKLLAGESHQLQEQMIHEIRAAMDVQVYWTEKVTTSNRRQFHVCIH
jgi:hypothetical protein